MSDTDENKRRLEAARILGFDVPANAKDISAAGAVTLGISPEGIEGAEVLAQLINHCFLQARMAGAPPEILIEFGTALIGGFSLAIAGALAGMGEIDESNPLAKIIAESEQTSQDRASRAIALCKATSGSLIAFAEYMTEQEQEEDTTPKLVDREAAAELARLFEASGAEDA